MSDVRYDPALDDYVETFDPCSGDADSAPLVCRECMFDYANEHDLCGECGLCMGCCECDDDDFGEAA